MRELLKVLPAFIAGMVVFTFVILIGFFYSLGYSIYMSVTLKNWKAFFRFWWSIIDGTLATVAYLLFHIVKGWDYQANIMGGELMEDVCTYHEETRFREKLITISAAIGELELRDGEHINLYKFGNGLSKVLNLAFRQAKHCTDSWLYKVNHDTMKQKYFN